MKKWLVILTMAFLILPAPASAFCFLGIGTSCGDDSATPALENGNLFERAANFVKRNFNLDEGKQLSFLGYRGSDTTTREEVRFNQDDIRDDFDKGSFNDGGSYALDGGEGLDVDLGVDQVYDTPLRSTDARWHDVDVKAAEIKCLNCIIKDNRQLLTAGFIYQIDFLLFNHGNHPATDVEVKIKLHETENTYNIDLTKTRSLYLPPADYRLSVNTGDQVGVDPETGKLYSTVIYTGTNDENFSLDYSIELFNDDGVDKLGETIKTRKVQSCEVDQDDEPVCFLVNERVIIYTCPDGSQIKDNNIEDELPPDPDNCDLSDPRSQDTKDGSFSLHKLTPDLQADARLKVEGLI